MGINKVILVGNLGKDPELKYTPAGVPVVTFSLATTERFSSKEGQRQEKTEWHNIVAWRRLAELANQYLKKGRTVYLEGKITTRSWDDRDGNKRYRTEIVADQIEFLGAGPGGGGGVGGGTGGPETRGPTASTPSSVPPQVEEPPPAPAQAEAMPEDDLPF